MNQVKVALVVSHFSLAVLMLSIMLGYQVNMNATNSPAAFGVAG